MKLKLSIRYPDGSLNLHEISGDSTTIGRSRRADLMVPDRFVSRLHARVARRAGNWFLESVGSVNPILLNGQILDESVELQHGDVIRVGETALEVLLGGVAAAAAAPVTAEADAWREDRHTILRPASTLMDMSSLDLATQLSEGEREQFGERIQLLNDVHRALAGPVTIDEVLELILSRAFDVLRPEEGLILLLGDDGEYRPAASRRASGEEGEVTYSSSLVREVTQKGLAALVVDASSDLRFAGSESILASGVRSIVAAPMLAEDGCHGMIALTSRAHVRRFSEPDMHLLVSLASAAALRLRNIALTDEAAERRVLENELALGHEIQMSMLPREFPLRPEFELAAALRPAKSVGGDLYSYNAGERNLWFLVGDVSGKGVGAALFMAVTRTLFHALVHDGSSLPDVMARMNRELCRDNERAMFVTAFLGRLELATGRLEFASAGHNPPYLVAADGSLESVSGGVGIPLGVLEDYVYASAELALTAGDVLYLYTDGITEALDSQDREFGTERLEAYLRLAVRESAEDVVQGTLGVVEGFVSGAPQSDDITVMAVRYRGGLAGADSR